MLTAADGGRERLGDLVTSQAVAWDDSLGVAERREELRAADSDRQFVAERLQAALNEGRLNLSEYDERLRARPMPPVPTASWTGCSTICPASITGRDSVVPAQPAAATPAPSPRRSRPPVPEPGYRTGSRRSGAAGSRASVICVVIWLLSGAGRPLLAGLGDRALGRPAPAAYAWPACGRCRRGAPTASSRRGPAGAPPGAPARPALGVVGPRQAPGRHRSSRHARPRGSGLPSAVQGRVDYPIGAQRPHCHACPALRWAGGTAAGADVPRHLRWIL